MKEIDYKIEKIEQNLNSLQERLKKESLTNSEVIEIIGDIDTIQRGLNNLKLQVVREHLK